MSEPQGPAAVSFGPEQLARLHLRVGSLLLARAELEALAAAGNIGGSGLVDLAEARWRSGNLEGAGTAAADHLAAGGAEPLALVILAESAAADGRKDEADQHIAALGPFTEPRLSAMFAGMPRRADWTTLGLVDSGDGLEDEDAAPGPSRRSRTGARSTAETAASRPSTGSGASKGRSRPEPTSAFPDADGLLLEARADMRSGETQRMGLAFDRLALALRWHPSVASDVVELVARRQEPAALLVRGDALRSLGRLLEAEAAYTAAAAALDLHRRRPG